MSRGTSLNSLYIHSRAHVICEKQPHLSRRAVQRAMLATHNEIGGVLHAKKFMAISIIYLPAMDTVN